MTAKEEKIADLDVRHAGRRVWLVKLPNFVADAWSKTGNMPVGTVQIKEDKESGKPPEMTLSLKGDYAESMPKQYNLQYTQTDTYMQIFSESEGALALEGNVEFKCDMKPVISEEYHHLLKNRGEKASIKTRTLQTIDISDVNAISSRPTREQTAPKKRKIEDKRERIVKDDLVDLIFSLFEKTTYYDFNELLKATNQPQLYLKETLNDLCIYNKRGPYKGKYCLKKQYGTKAEEGKVDVIK